MMEKSKKASFELLGIDMKQLINKVGRKLSSIKQKYIYNTKNILLNGVASSIFTPPILREIIYKQLGYKIGKDSMIYPQCFCGVGNGSKGKLILGDYSYINYRCFLDLGDDIIIGNHVAIAFNCTFVNSSHELGNEKQRAGKNNASKIIIEDGCWIGARTTIMPGVTIRKGCVVGSDSLVLKDTEPNGLYVGHPAKRIRTLE